MTVLVLESLSVSEEDGTVQVCSIKQAFESSERDFAVTLASNDSTG